MSSATFFQSLLSSVAPTSSSTSVTAPPPTNVLRLCRTWTVECPPAKKAMVAGKLVPTVKGTLTLGGRLWLKPKKRRLTIEIRGPSDTNQNNPNHSNKSNNTEKQEVPVQRGLARTKQTIGQAFQLSHELLDDDRIVIRILKPRKAWGFHRDPDDSSDSDSDTEIDTHNNNDQENDNKISNKTRNDDNKSISTKSTDSSGSDDNNIGQGWVEYRKYGMDGIVDELLTGPDNTIFEATMGLGSSQERRELKFDTPEQALDFWKEFTQLKALVQKRAQNRLDAFHDSHRQNLDLTSSQQPANTIPATITPPPSDMTPQSEIQLLIEIVSATHLPIADRIRKSTDPLVVVYLGNEQIHRTRHIPRTVNPIWTIDTGSLFLLSTTAQDFFRASAGLTFVVHDNDRIKANDILAMAVVPHTTLLQLKETERLALPLQILQRHKFHSEKNRLLVPTLYIRARQATPADRKFMKQVFSVQNRKLLGVYADQNFIGPQTDRIYSLRREFKVVDGIRKYRVKPGPDPSRPEQETKWMSSEDIYKEIMKPTYQWIEAGTGGLGRLYLEVLKCDGLPNMDARIDGKTDAFCCIVYEDAIVNTDVIKDTLRPRWVPWCQRGFMFRLSHPSSQVLIGVFDHDSDKGVNAFNSHDAIGRITIDITNFRPSTEYVLTYDLYRSVLATDRRKFGTLTVRLRIEYEDYRNVVIRSFTPPPIHYINLPTKAGFRCSYFVVHGEENVDRFDMNVVNSYRNELEGYLIVWHYIKEAAISIFLWRGQKEITLSNRKVLVPIHSAISFIMGVTLIENFNYLPSYCLFSIAWLLLATNEFRQQHPSPWHSSLTYLQLWQAVWTNEAPPETVRAHQNEDAIHAYEAEMKRCQEKEVARARQARETAERIDALFSDERNSAAEAFHEDEFTKLGAYRPSLNPLAKTLLPIQQTLGDICKALRIISSVILWDESIYAFLIVTSCLVLGFVFLWIPWSIILRWVLRILVWSLLGPWMKLVDIYYVQVQEHNGEDESEFLRRLFEEKLNALEASREVLMKAKEEIFKARAMRKVMFGRFVTRVPQFKEYRFPDVPRPESYAQPAGNPDPVTIERRSYGQTLVGQMIPTWGDALDTPRQEGKKKTLLQDLELRVQEAIHAIPLPRLGIVDSVTRLLLLGENETDNSEKKKED